MTFPLREGLAMIQPMMAGVGGSAVLADFSKLVQYFRSLRDFGSI